jgi:hypothetical protein
MKQKETIQQLKSFFNTVKGIDLALLYGSFARGTMSVNSDIDIQFLIDNTLFEENNFISSLKKEFGEKVLFIHSVKANHKIVLYLTSHPKIEFSIYTHLDEIAQMYLGSEITNVKDTILYTNTYWSDKIEKYLLGIIEKYQEQRTEKSLQNSMLELVDEFLYYFEGASAMHKRSDSYQFYFLYNIALHKAIQIYNLSKGETKFNFLPKRFVSSFTKEEERKEIYQLDGILLLDKANEQKRKLLNFFYTTLTKIPTIKKEEIKHFCEFIFKRDYFWNFRDISLYNPLIKKELIYRTANFVSFFGSDEFESLMRKTNIKTVVDLRANKEIEKLSYSAAFKERFNYVLAPFDPWKQPDWFIKNYHYGTDIEIAYRFFLLGCKDSVKKTMLTILHQKEGAVAIHCFAGKDRTGTLISLLHLLSGATMEVVYDDYLASELDTEISKLGAALEIVKAEGGVIPYLLSCGLKQEEIEALKQKITYR